VGGVDYGGWWWWNNNEYQCQAWQRVVQGVRHRMASEDV
jgi:hypothetical protein